MKPKEIPLSADVTYIMNKLRTAGYRADVVGGAVRDFLLGKTAGDYDITTSATPSEMLCVFSDDRVVKTGLKHGTVSVILGSTAYEITSYRIDGEYEDARHPSEVKFTRDIALDLARRDFTVNAIAYNPLDGYTDLYSGLDDLKSGVIRAVGVPEERFSEDALRILRAIRFSSVLDFRIEEKTSQALYKTAPLLEKISRERIYTEWCKLLAGKAAHRVLAHYSALVKYFIPALDGFSLPKREEFDSASPFIRFVSLFGDKSPSDFNSTAYALRSDTKTRELGTLLLERLDTELDTKYAVKTLMSEIGEERARLEIELRRTLSREWKTSLSFLNEITEAKECYSLAELDIRGDDLISLGIKGKDIGGGLVKLLHAVMRGDAENNKEALKSYILSHK